MRCTSFVSTLIRPPYINSECRLGPERTLLASPQSQRVLDPNIVSRPCFALVLRRYACFAGRVYSCSVADPSLLGCWGQISLLQARPSSFVGRCDEPRNGCSKKGRKLLR